MVYPGSAGKVVAPKTAAHTSDGTCMKVGCSYFYPKLVVQKDRNQDRTREGGDLVVVVKVVQANCVCYGCWRGWRRTRRVHVRHSGCTASGRERETVERYGYSSSQFFFLM